MIKEGHIFRGIGQPVELRLRELIEPNYGRMRWTFELFIDGQQVLNDLIGANSYLLPDLDGFQFLSKSEEYAFFPLEGRGLVLHLGAGIYHDLLPYEMSNNDFVSNHFLGEYLVVNYRREIQIHHMTEAKTQRVVFASGQYHIMDSSFSLDDGLWITYKDLESYQTKKGKYDLESEAWIEAEMS
ncbi:MAG: hypothetical protein AAGA85_18080 [Bacteroidota bacterium]